MIVSISQPRYLPWLGYFHRLAVSDVFVYLDHVQYTPRDWENRNKIKGPHGGTWLTVPIKASYRALIPEVLIDNEQAWGERHWKSLDNVYRRAPHFAQYADEYRQLLSERRWERLTDLNLAVTARLATDLGLGSRPILRSSEMSLTATGSDLILEICRRTGARVYLSGSQGRNYLHEAAFTDAGIRVVYQDYRHPVYPQLHGEFMAFMAAVDVLFNCGPRSLAIICEDQGPVENSR
jgi:hypothetical protein